MEIKEVATFYIKDESAIKLFHILADNFYPVQISTVPHDNGYKVDVILSKEDK